MAGTWGGVDMPLITHVGECAFYQCVRLESAAPPITAEIHPDAFLRCDPARLAIRFVGVLAADDLDRPNAFPALNKYTRTAAVAHRLPDFAGDVCVVQRTWPASEDQLAPPGLPEDPEGSAAKHDETAPGPATAVVDATGIVLAIPLQTLAGDEFPVHGCCDGPGADFKALTAAQHPEQLGDQAAWAVLVGPEAEEPSDTVDLDDMALRLVTEVMTLPTRDEPWMLVWK